MYSNSFLEAPFFQIQMFGAVKKKQKQKNFDYVYCIFKYFWVREIE